MNCIIAQSGGPTSVINSSLAGAIKAAIDFGYEHIYLSLHGIEGILKADFREVDKDKFDGILDMLKARPSSILGSCRYKLADDFDDPAYEKIFSCLRSLDIRTFVYIGGNDSMDTVTKLNSYMEKKAITGINVVGCPKTIDNDLNGMDHSPGFPSAAKFIATTLRTLRTDVDIYDLKSVTVVEIMGRHAGWLAGSSLVANYNYPKDLVNLVYLPEMDKSIDEMMDEISEKLAHENNLIIALAEGFRDRDLALDKIMFDHAKDGFAHPIVSGVGIRLADYIRNNLGIKSRCVELNIPQRTSAIISRVDADEAFNLGYRAMKLGRERTNLLPVLRRKSSDPYEVFYTEVEAATIANQEMKIPEAWLKDFETLEANMISYTLPLIQGEVDQVYEDGMPVFVDLDAFTK